MPDPSDAGFYVRYVEICRRAGVGPNSPQGVRELIGKWNAMLSGPTFKSLGRASRRLLHVPIL